MRYTPMTGWIERLVTQIAWIAEVNAAFLIQGHVVRRVEGAAVVHPGEDKTHAGPHVGTDHAASAVVGPFANQHVPGRVELDAVRHAAGRTEDRRLPCRWIKPPDVAGMDFTSLVP